MCLLFRKYAGLKNNMVINKINFPIYGILIILSLTIGMIFNYIYLRKNKIQKEKIILFTFMLIVYGIFGGIFLNAIVNKEINQIGLSSYGGAIGILIATLIFEKMSNSKGIFIKSAILNLPLIYSISKLSCFFAGCCYGIPYNGIFSVTYTEGLNIPLFPVQLAETIVFFMVFIFSVLNIKNQNIIEITIILSAISKFLLDFLRYSHLENGLSVNQWISIGFVVIGIVILIKKKEFWNKN